MSATGLQGAFPAYTRRVLLTQLVSDHVQHSIINLTACLKQAVLTRHIRFDRLQLHYRSDLI